MSEKECGCVPNEYTCGNCSIKERERIRATMSEKDKAYDDMVTARPGIAWDLNGLPEGCTCHISPPCSFCVGLEEKGNV